MPPSFAPPSGEPAMRFDGHAEVSAPSPVAGSSESSRRADQRAAALARRNAVTSVAGLVALAGIWGAAELARALRFPERSTKVVIAAGIALAASVQILLGLAMTVFENASTPRRIVRLRHLHRTLGAVALLGGAFVTYLCMTGPFPGGPTGHRIIGFGVCAIAIAKLVVATNASQRRVLLTTLGLVLGLGLIGAFLTKAFDALWTPS